MKGSKGIADIAGYGNKTVIEALLSRLINLDSTLFPPSDYSFIDSVIQNITRGVTCLVDISGISSEDIEV